MTLTMLPPAPKDVGRLSDVFASALGAILGGELNRLKLARVPSAVVAVVDGLGFSNLKDHPGHARHLTKLLKSSGEQAIRCGFPSTTAVSLTSFGTGLRAGAHGVLGYQVLGQDGAVRNMLNGWQGGENPRDWQSNPTISEIGKGSDVEVHMVASPEYENSGFTNVIMGGASFHGVQNVAERTVLAHKLATQNNTLVYVYFAELDQAAHRFGVDSEAWRATLESIDAALFSIEGNYGIIITADHGIVDVPTDNHVYLDSIAGFQESVTLAIGDPRALFCYGDKKKAHELLAASNVSCFVADFEELIRQGWVSGVQTIDVVPDFVLLAKGNVAFYDRRTAKPQSLRMIGQHGSISDAETRVPFIRAGLFA